ncbi:MAG TPA: hypothetical protein VLW47_13225, partial [Thermodesulfobacteriota bacterium]|nr:hypothetical protein [Thermodesulfobacteriota bacterium]
EKAFSFEEINEKENQISEGYSELLIQASIKIPQEETYVIKTRPPGYGNLQYPFVFNVNGQGVLWMVNRIFDEQAMYVRHKINPEGGAGLMCRLEKRVRLKSGSYKVYMGLPEEEFETEVTISLVDGSSNVLEFKPIYLWHRIHQRTFRNGISHFDIFFNSKPYRSHTTHRDGWKLGVTTSSLPNCNQTLYPLSTSNSELTGQSWSEDG